MVDCVAIPLPFDLAVGGETFFILLPIIYHNADKLAEETSNLEDIK